MPRTIRLLALGVLFVVWNAADALAASSWQTLQLSRFYLHYQPVDTRIANQIAAQADEMYQAITADVGYWSRQKITVYLCPTPECFQQQQPSSVKLPEWAVGAAYPALSRMIVRSALTRKEKGQIKPLEIFKHELAHIVLEQALADNGGAPRWLSEGFSMYYARQWAISGQRTLTEVTLNNAFIPLSILTTSFPADENAARIAYSQSFSLVAFLLNDERYGRRVFHKLINNLKQGMDANSALLSAAGVSLDRLEAEWRTSLKNRYSWFNYLIDIGLFWFLLSVGFFVIYLIKHHKVKQIQEQWEEAQQLFEESRENDAKEG